jgi:hypothetical protein
MKPLESLHAISEGAGAGALQHRRPPLQRLLAGPKATMAQGSQRTASSKRAVVTLDNDTFDRVAMLAAASRVTFAEAIRQLVRSGLDAHDGGRR